ncbi:hypothetical protein CISIN_1g045310mg, partial [Citrus sinensis]
IDQVNFPYKYSLIDGDGLMDKLEIITYEIKFEPTPEGGSRNKTLSTYYIKGDISAKEKALGMYKVLEAHHLLQNPEAYA